MALPPGTTSESFIREVDENLRRDQAEEFARRWGKWLVAALLLLLVAVGGFLYWRNQQTEQAAAESEQLAAAFDDIDANRRPAAEQKLGAIAAGDGRFSGLARMTQAAFALQNGDRAKAIAAYREIAADTGEPEELRNAALVRQTALEFDSLKPEEVISRLQPLSEPGKPWFGSAGEMTAMAMLKANRRQEAGQLFARISADQNVPGTLRSRAVQIAGTLGVDASAQLPVAAR